MNSDFDVPMFKLYLENETSVSPTTIKQYVACVSAFLKETKTTELEDPNSYNTFIIRHCMKKRSVHYYYALKKYIEWKHKGDIKRKIIDNLEQASFFDDIKPERERRYLNEEERISIINDLKEKKHKVIALIQNSTGVRSGDIFRLQKPLGIIPEKEKDRIYLRLNITGKGGKRKPVPIYDEIIIATIMEYLESSIAVDQYYFLDNKYGPKDPSLDKLFERNYVRYRKDLKEACKNNGVKPNEFDTHDFRRNFARDFWLKVKDIHRLQRLLGHDNIETTTRYLRHSGLDSVDDYKDMQGISDD